MTNRELFIDGYLDRIATQYPQSKDLNENRNLAFEIFSIAAIIDKPFQEVYDNILISGKKDGGFDGIWFQDLGEYYVMHVFQCKNKKSLSANEVDKFKADYREIFTHGNKAGKQNISDLQPWIDQYQQITSQGVIIDTKWYFVYNGLNNAADNANNKVIFETYNEPHEGFNIIDAAELYTRVANFARQKRNEIKFTFHPQKSNISALDIQGLYSFAIQDIRAANFRISATELCKLMDYEKEINGAIDTLFEENIRSYLGVTVRANKNMDETLNNRELAVYFPFLNNGITIICEDLKLPKNPQNDEYLLPVKNPQIVNGLQTSWVIYKNYQRNPAILKDIYVNIRVYESTDKELIDKITDATNTQTPINYRDKISNKAFNTITKEVFGNAGVNYLTKRGENFQRESIVNKESIDSETVIKFWYATFYEEPQTAKNSIAMVLQKIFDASTLDKHPLEELFSGSIDSPIYKQLLAAYRIYRFVQNQKSAQLPNNEVLAYTDELMCYGIYKYIGTTDFGLYTNTATLKTAFDDTLNTIKEIVNKEKQAHHKIGRTFSYNAYFKKPKCKVDFDSLKDIVASDTLFDDVKNIK